MNYSHRWLRRFFSSILIGGQAIASIAKGNINTSDLIDKVNWILNNQKECDQIALNANNEFKKKYSYEENYKQLLEI